MRPGTLFVFAITALSGSALTACAPYGRDADESTAVGVQGQESALFSALDANRDGVISRDELMTYFLAHDSTEDGALDAGEFAAFESPERVSPDHPGDAEANGVNTDFPEPLRNPSPTGPEVASPPATRGR